MKKNNKTADKLEKLTELFKRGKKLLIILQDHPDPDAVAGGAALRQLANRFGLTCSLAHGGMVGRTENRALVNYLGINLRRLSEIDPASFDLIAMIDTQPETGNNQLPEHIRPQIVIDHHPRRTASRGIPFTDIRGPYGSTSTILCEYLQAFDIIPEPRLATALLYGLLSDTSELGREAGRADIEAHLWLSSYANLRMLAQIRNSPLNPDYFALLYHALANAKTYGNCIYVDIGTGENPDMPGEIADLLVRKEQVLWCLCLIRTSTRIILSLRGSDQEKDAGRFIRRIVGSRGTSGGHLTFAGGQVPIEDKQSKEIDNLIKEIQDNFLQATGQIKTRGRKLVPIKKRKKRK